jgi:AcrR family transcriptional regulator
MTDRSASRGIVSRDRWAAQIAALDDTQSAPRSRREPITVGRIVDAALQVVEAEGFDALTMRRVAAALQASPGALYAHVRDKAELDDLMIGELCSRVTLPVPDPAQWTHSLETLRINEGLLAILLAGEVPLQTGAWAIDAAFLYIGAYSVMSLRRHNDKDTDGRVVDRAELIERLRMLPPDRFPITAANARELTSGEGHDRFDFTLGLLLGGLTPDTS